MAVLTALGASQLALFSAAAAPASAASTSPPFDECPSIGAAPTCGILLVINPDLSVSVASDSSVGTYDSDDDTLVGVVNDASSTVNALTITGSSGPFGFDGDGICTYDVALPCGTTGYEGPGVSFVLDPNSVNDGEVDFQGGLIPGATAYFGLESALDAASVVVHDGSLNGSVSPSSGPPGSNFEFTYPCSSGSPTLTVLGANGQPATGVAVIGLPVTADHTIYDQGVRPALAGSYTAAIACGSQTLYVPFRVVVTAPYAALGDSYASGEGAKKFDPSTNMPGLNLCHRATSGWAYQVAKKTDLGMVFAACSGATIQDFYNYNADNPLEIPQLDQLSKSVTKLVTLTIGGNNVGFEGVLADCIHGGSHILIKGIRALGRPGCATRDAKAIDQALKWLKDGRSASPAGKCPHLPGIDPDTGKPDSVCDAQPALHTLYENIAQDVAPGAKIVVAGYPQLFSSQAEKSGCPVGGIGSGPLKIEYGISGPDVKALNSAAQALNATIQDQIDSAKKWLKKNHVRVTISFVSVDDGFKLNRLCDARSWINGLQLDLKAKAPKQTSFHPNTSGQKEYGILVSRHL